MRFRTYIGLISAFVVVVILGMISIQTRRILDRGFRDLGTAEVARASEIVKAVIKSKRDNLTSFKRLISADKEVTQAISEGRLKQKLNEMKELGHFDFVDFIFPNGTSAFANEKQFGSGTDIDRTVDPDGFSVVKSEGKILLVAFCLKHREHGILVLGFSLSGPFEKRLSELTGSEIKFVLREGDGRKPSDASTGRAEPKILEVAHFPQRSLIAQISLNWGWIESIDLGLRKSLLYSGIISLLFLLCLMYLLLEVGFVRPFESILRTIKKASYDLEEGRVPNIEFKNHPISDLQWLSRSFAKFSESIGRYDEKSKEHAIASVRAENRAALTAQARQVAHDIRSPLSAMELFMEKLDQLPEETRTKMKDCVARVLDVANTLLEKFKEADDNTSLKPEAGGHGGGPQTKVNSLLTTLIDPIVSEKRIQYKNQKDIQIRFEFDADSYGLFALVNPQVFKRILSNIIDNAVEAIDEKGEVIVTLRPAGKGKVQVAVKDNGKGIPEKILNNLGQCGATYGKPNGSGLGLYFAKSVIEEAGGEMTILSTIGEGTSVEAVINSAAAPDWFVPELIVLPGSKVVVLDDDPSIHHLWEERFKGLGNLSQGVSLLHFTKAADLVEHHDTSTGLSSISLYLCDFELLGQGVNGLDVIEQLCIQDRAVLVTTHFDKESIRTRCSQLGVRIFPKRFARYIPISILQTDL